MQESGADPNVAPGSPAPEPPPEPDERDERDERDEHEGHDAPGWLRLAAIISGAGTLGFGGVGLALAIPGWYRPAVVLPLGLVATVALVACARPAWRSAQVGAAGRQSDRRARAHVPAAIGVAVILAVTVWNVSHTSEHVLSDRDPGIYAAEGRWIARSGHLDVHPAVGPFANDPTLDFNSFGTSTLESNAHLSVLFAHMLPVLLAEAYAVGGNHLLFWLPDLLGGVALLAFFVLAWRLLRRPWFALAATAAFAFVLPQVNFTRDTYSEIPSQVLLFTALWLLTTRRPAPHWRVMLVAGLLLGAMQGVRIDALAFAIGLPLLFAVGWLRAEREGGAARLRFVRSGIAFLVGGTLGFLLGYIDLTRRSAVYYSTLSGDVHSLVKAFVVAVVIGIVIVLLWPRGSKESPDRPTARRLAVIGANAAGALVAIAGFATWALRPHLMRVRGSEIDIGDLQTAEHHVVDLTRRYYEYSLSWMNWYLGPILLAAAIIGAALLVRALLRGKEMHWLAALVVLGPVSVLYLWNPNAVPDQVWVDRRFLCSAIPALILLGFGVAAVVWDATPKPPLDKVTRPLAAGIALFGVGYPIYSTFGVRDMTSQRGDLAVIDDTCKLVGKHAAVVVVASGSQDLTPEWIAQPLRAWCGADVEVMLGGPAADDLDQLAARTRALGRSLFVVGSEAGVGVVRARAALEPTREAVNRHLLERTLTHRPDAYVTERFSLFVARVDNS